MKPFSISVKELVALGADHIPEEFIPACHLIYSSPATLFYNSPGAVGFGVKRAALVLPESAMLLVAPNACGRNSTVMSTEEGYADRMFYLPMSETDLVTGRHLSRIPEAIHEIMEVADPKPKAIVICITCVDALLGTDLPRICRKAEEENDVLVIPSYMYAIEREGKKPPMVAIRETLYSLLERPSVDPRAVNLLGFFSELDPDSDLLALLKGAGIRTVNQISAMKTLDDYYEMGKANFNIVLHPESVYAAGTLQKRLNMPFLELHRLYDPDRIHNQYRLFGSAVGVTMDDEAMYERYRQTKRLRGEIQGHQRRHRRDVQRQPLRARDLPLPHGPHGPERVLEPDGVRLPVPETARRSEPRDPRVHRHLALHGALRGGDRGPDHRQGRRGLLPERAPRPLELREAALRLHGRRGTPRGDGRRPFRT